MSGSKPFGRLVDQVTRRMARGGADLVSVYRVVRKLHAKVQPTDCLTDSLNLAWAVFGLCGGGREK